MNFKAEFLPFDEKAARIYAPIMSSPALHRSANLAI